MRQRGFTLLEMLVAMTVFLLAFTSLYGLFLVGSRHRVKAEGITRTSLAASSLIAEFRLTMGSQAKNDGTPFTPAAYNGDGFPVDVGSDPDRDSDELFSPYPDQPGIWYRVVNCTDLKGDSNNERTGALRFKLKVLYYPTGNVEPGPNGYLQIESWLAPRLNLSSGGSQRQEWVVDYNNDNSTSLTASDLETLYLILEERSILHSYDAIVLRRPSW